MKIVKSKNIKHIHYDPETKTLEVGFHAGGHVYSYHDVSEEEYKAFENAKSHGSHFADNIKKKYHGRRKKDKK